MLNMTFRDASQSFWLPKFTCTILTIYIGKMMKINNNDNVELATFDELPNGQRLSIWEFIINTEPNDLKPEEIVENLKSILNQK